MARVSVLQKLGVFLKSDLNCISSENTFETFFSEVQRRGDVTGEPGGRLSPEHSFPSPGCSLGDSPHAFSPPMQVRILLHRLSVLGCISDLWRGFLLTTVQCLCSVLKTLLGCVYFFQKSCRKRNECIFL